MQERTSFVVITFAGSANKLCEYSRMDANNKADAIRNILSITSQPATNIEAALHEAKQLIFMYPHHYHQMLLLTDGEPNAGNTCPIFRASQTTIFKDVHLMLFTEESCALFGQCIVNCNGNAVFVKESQELHEEFVGLAKKLATGHNETGSRHIF